MTPKMLATHLIKTHGHFLVFIKWPGKLGIRPPSDTLAASSTATQELCTARTVRLEGPQRG